MGTYRLTEDAKADLIRVYLSSSWVLFFLNGAAEGTPVEQDILSHDKAGMLRTQKNQQALYFTSMSLRNRMRAIA